MSDGHGNSDAVHEVFSEHGLRCTRQRRALYEALVSTDRHPTADELYCAVCRQVEGLSLATVYNTLEAFCRVGLAQRIHGDNGSARYDAATDNHLHLRCQRTGAVADVPDHVSERLLRSIPQHVLDEIARELGFEVKQVQIELLGQFRGDSRHGHRPAQSARG